MVKKGAIPWAELKAKEIALNCDGSKSSVFGEMSKLAPPELLGALENRAASLQRQGAAEVYLKEFPYGQVVAQQGELIEEIIEGEGLEIPFGILLDGCIEIFEPADISKDAIANPLISNSRALRILPSGKLIGLYEALNRIFRLPPVEGNWSIASGARTIFFLGNYQTNLAANMRRFISDPQAFFKQEAVPAPVRSTTTAQRGDRLAGLDEPWAIAKEIATRARSDWTTKILFFPNIWTALEDGPSDYTPLHRHLMREGWQAVQYYLDEERATQLYDTWYAYRSTLTGEDKLPGKYLPIARELLIQVAMCVRGKQLGFVPYRLAAHAGPFQLIARVLNKFVDENGAHILIPGHLTAIGSRDVFLSGSILRRALEESARGSEGDLKFIRMLHDDLTQIARKSLPDAVITGISSNKSEPSIFPLKNELRSLKSSTALPFGLNSKDHHRSIRSHVELHSLLHASTLERPNRSSTENERGAFLQLARNDEFLKAALRVRVRDSSALVLGEIASRVYGRYHARGDTAIVVHNHLLPSATALFDHLLHIVAAPQQVFILGKSYSTIPAVERRLRDCMFVVQPDQHQRAAALGDYELGIKQNIEAFWAQHENSLNSFHKIIMCDDGCRLARWIPESLKSKTIVVEQTSSGSRASSEYKVHLPIIDVGRSAAKRCFESQTIATAVRHQMIEGGVSLKEATIGIIGYGYLGSQVASSLQPSSKNIIVFENEKKRRSDAETQGFALAESLEQIVRDCTIVVGCGGTAQLTEKHFAEKKHDPIELVSCSSGDIEFSSILRALRQSRQSESDYGADVSGEIGGSQVTVRNGGFPINFNRVSELEPDQEIMLTRALYFAGICWANELIERRPAPGLIRLHPNIQKWVCEHHYMHHTQPIEALPKDDSFWSVHSEGRPEEQ